MDGVAMSWGVDGPVGSESSPPPAHPSLSHTTAEVPVNEDPSPVKAQNGMKLRQTRFKPFLVGSTPDSMTSNHHNRGNSGGDEPGAPLHRLHAACSRCDKEAASRVMTLIQADYDPYERDPLGRVPLHYCQDIQVARALMSRHFDDEEATALGARMHGWSLRRWAACPYVFTQFDVNMQDNNGETPLFSAVRRRLFGLAVFILSVRAKVNLVNAQGLRCLHVAAAHGDSLMIAKLILENAQVDAIVTPCHIGDSSVRITALHMAIYSGHFSACEALLIAGANPCIHPHPRLTTLDLAIRCGNRDIIGLVQHEFMILNLDSSSPHYEAIKRALKLSMRILLQGPGQVDVRMCVEDSEDGNGDEEGAMGSDDSITMSTGKAVSLLHKLYCTAQKPWWDAEDAEAPMRTTTGLVRSGTVSIHRKRHPWALNRSQASTAHMLTPSPSIHGLHLSLSDKALNELDLNGSLRPPRGSMCSRRKGSMPDPSLVSAADKYKMAVPGRDVAVVDGQPSIVQNGHATCANVAVSNDTSLPAGTETGKSHSTIPNESADCDPTLNRETSAMGRRSPPLEGNVSAQSSTHATNLYYSPSGDTIEVRKRRLNSFTDGMEHGATAPSHWEEADDNNEALGSTHPLPNVAAQQRSPGTIRRSQSVSGTGSEKAQPRTSEGQSVDDSAPRPPLVLSQTWAEAPGTGMKLVRAGSQSSWTSASYSCDDNDWPEIDIGGQGEEVTELGLDKVSGKGSGMFVTSSVHLESQGDTTAPATPNNDIFEGESWDRKSESSSLCDSAIIFPNMSHSPTSPSDISKRPPRSPQLSSSPGSPLSSRSRHTGSRGRGPRASHTSALNPVVEDDECSTGSTGVQPRDTTSNTIDDRENARTLRRHTDSATMVAGGKGYSSSRDNQDNRTVGISAPSSPMSSTHAAPSPTAPESVGDNGPAGSTGIPGPPASPFANSSEHRYGTASRSPLDQRRAVPSSVRAMRDKYRARVGVPSRSPLTGRGPTSTPVTPNRSRRSSFDYELAAHPTSQVVSPAYNARNQHAFHSQGPKSLDLSASPRRLRARHSQDGFENSFVLPRPLEDQPPVVSVLDELEVNHEEHIDRNHQLADELAKLLVGIK